MTAGVVIPNYQGRELLARYLPVLVERLPGIPITVVDDGSADGSVDFLKSNFPDVNVIARPANGGFSAAVNDGIRAAKGDLVILLNNDVEIAPVLYANGCAAVYRRSMLKDLGGFDEAYSPFYWEDTDLGYRAWKRGWKSLYQPAGAVVHQHSASISRFDSRLIARIQLRNAFMFVWRNIEDAGTIAAHRRWLPAILARKAVGREWAWVSGWREAFKRRRECVEARNRDSKNRMLSDVEILDLCVRY